MKTTLIARCKAAGVNYDTARARRQRGWPENELCVPPLAPNHAVRKARLPNRSHPWRRENAADTFTAQLSALNLRKTAKRERAR